MKVLSFSAIEILPALLNKTKIQTIRPAWFGKWQTIKGMNGEIPTVYYKTPRFKSGEEIRLEWKSRNSPKGSWFCSKCGKEAIITPKELPYQHLYVKVKSPKGGLDNHARRTQPEAQRR
jgi:hypothetical protein